MELRIFVEPQQGATYDDQLAVALKAEELGFGAFFRSDHYLAMGVDGRPGPTDSWVTLAGLARETSTIRLGTMMTSATFRHPGPLAISVAQVDQMSGGRVELGIGAGWYDAEHTAYAIPFPPTRERFDMLEDQLAILTGLWATPEGETFSYDGVRHSVTDSPGLPKPAQRPRPPIIVGGKGARRTPALAARYADEFNLSSSSPAKAAEVSVALDEACRAIGREPATLARSTMAGVLVGRTADEVAERERTVLETFGPDAQDDGETWLEERRNRWIYGTPDEARAQLERFAAAGMERIMLQDFLPWDLDMIDVMGEVLVGQV
jgi:F420-dependent oxidoreductase-like protein